MHRFAALICAFTLVVGCSRTEDSPPVPAAKPDDIAAAAAPAPAPTAYVPVPAELLPHLVRTDSPVLGPPKAPVTLVEFLDPACEACRAYAPVVKQIQFLYPEEVRVVVRFADFHPVSEGAIRMLLAAQQQKKFEPVLSALFEQQDQWASHHAADIQAAWKIAAAAGLDVARARKVAGSVPVANRLQEEAEDLQALQVSSTPTFFVNGKLIADARVNQLMEAVAAEVKAAAAAE